MSVKTDELMIGHVFCFYMGAEVFELPFLEVCESLKRGLEIVGAGLRRGERSDREGTRRRG